MRQTGEQQIAAPIAVVWRALNDPEVLARCIEGCESLERTGDDAFQARVRAKVGPVSAVFGAEIAITDAQPPHAYTLTGSVKGGPAGFGKGSARVNLAEADGTTVLRYEVEGSVGGKLAQVGQRLIDATARKMADDFFSAFKAAVASEAVAPDPAPAEPAAGRREAPPRTFIWVALAAVAALAIIILIRR